jgi:hypothetical protein
MGFAALNPSYELGVRGDTSAGFPETRKAR